MIKRTVAGVIMAGLLFLIIYLTSLTNSQIVFDMLALAACFIATFEMYGATKRADTKIEGKKGYNLSVLSLLFALMIIYPLCMFYGYSGLLFTGILSVLFAFIVFIFDSKKDLNDFAVNVFVLFYPLILIGIIFVIGGLYGMIPIVLAIGISTISDAFACWFGAAFGKKKIFPKISPKKTIVGSVAGIIGGAAGGILVYLIFELASFPANIIFTFGSLVNNNVALTILIYALVGLAIAVFSELGDLAASRIKREAGIKDYGKILGSHGGIMDRIDSIVFTVVCVAVIMQIITIVT